MVLPVLRERFEIQNQVSTVDAAGQTSTAWADFKTVWAACVPAKTFQQTVAERDEAGRGYVGTIRYLAGVTTNSRILWRGLQLAVDGVVDKTLQRQYLTLTLTEKGS